MKTFPYILYDRTFEVDDNPLGHFIGSKMARERQGLGRRWLY